MRRVGSATFFALLHLIMTGSVSAANFGVGLVLGFGIATASGLGRAEPEPWSLRRLVGVPLFAGGLALELLGGSWTMLQVLVGRRTWREAGFVEVPLGRRSGRGAVVSGLAATVTPGSVVVEMDHRRGRMVMNVIDARDPDATRESAARFYERFQSPVLP